MKLNLFRAMGSHTLGLMIMAIHLVSMRLIPEQFGSVSTVFDSVQDQQEVVGIPHRKLNKLHRVRLSPTEFHSECCALTIKALMLDA